MGMEPKGEAEGGSGVMGRNPASPGQIGKITCGRGVGRVGTDSMINVFWLKRGAGARDGGQQVMEVTQSHCRAGSRRKPMWPHRRGGLGAGGESD